MIPVGMPAAAAATAEMLMVMPVMVLLVRLSAAAGVLMMFMVMPVMVLLMRLSAAAGVAMVFVVMPVMVFPMRLPASAAVVIFGLVLLVRLPAFTVRFGAVRRHRVRKPAAACVALMFPVRIAAVLHLVHVFLLICRMRTVYTSKAPP